MPEIPGFYFKSLPDKGEFVTAPGLVRKTDGNVLLPFRGETTVFLLPGEVKKTLALLRERIYSAAGEMLCRERLEESSFHMTLHDLWNVADERPAPAYSHEQIRSALTSIRGDYPEAINMRAVSLVSMVRTSVVLGLVPANAEAEAALGDMYSRLNGLWPVPYGLTPHITLAYYRPGSYPEEVWQKLGQSFAIDGFEFQISTENLVFQSFESMSEYHTA